MSNYGTVNAANAFFDSRLHSWDWEQAIVADRLRALVQATEYIEQFDYVGEKYAVNALGEDATDEEKRVARLSQPLEFPRGDVNEVPIEIEHACYLIAKALLSGRDPDMDLESLATKSTAYGDVRTAYNRDGNTMEHLAHLIPSPQAWNLLKPFLRYRNRFDTSKV